MAKINGKQMYTSGYVKRVRTQERNKVLREIKTDNIVIPIYSDELQNAFKSYDNFKQFLLDKFGVDVDYLEYIERIYTDEELL